MNLTEDQLRTLEGSLVALVASLEAQIEQSAAGARPVVGICIRCHSELERGRA